MSNCNLDDYRVLVLRDWTPRSWSSEFDETNSMTEAGQSKILVASQAGE